MLYRLLEQGTPEKWSHLRFVLLGGAAATPELIAKANAAGVRIATTYGMTEATSQIATMLPDDLKPGSVGKPLTFTELRIINESGDNQPTGNYGEVIVRGQTVMQGYYGNPEATNRTIRDGWLHTGDIGYLDNDGDLFIVQRRTDLIVSGGENVYPAEVEAVIRQHPAVKDVAVIGMTDAEWGQRVAAAIIPATESHPTPDDIITYCREHLAGYKVPRQIIFVDALPQTASGKIERKRVIELFI